MSNTLGKLNQPIELIGTLFSDMVCLKDYYIFYYFLLPRGRWYIAQ